MTLRPLERAAFFQGYSQKKFKGDELFRKQAVELDHTRRAELLHRMQQLVHEKVIAAPLWQLAGLSGVGPRVGESPLGSMAGYPWISPYEDMTLKGS